MKKREVKGPAIKIDGRKHKQYGLYPFIYLYRGLERGVIHDYTLIAIQQAHKRKDIYNIRVCRPYI